MAMEKAWLAEFVLARIMARSRAAEIVGDALEQGGSSVAFWWTIARVLFAMTWRWFVAVPAMLLVMVAAFSPFRNLVLVPLQREAQLPAQILPAAPHWLVWGGSLALAGMCLWSVAVLALCLFGWRERAVRVCITMAAVTTAASCMTKLPHAAVSVALLLVLTAGLLAGLRSTRHAFGVVLAAAVALAAGLAGGIFLIATLSTHLHTGEGLNDWVALSSFLAAVLLETWVLARTRRWALAVA